MTFYLIRIKYGMKAQLVGSWSNQPYSKKATPRTVTKLWTFSCSVYILWDEKSSQFPGDFWHYWSFQMAQTDETVIQTQSVKLHDIKSDANSFESKIWAYFEGFFALFPSHHDAILVTPFLRSVTLNNRHLDNSVSPPPDQCSFGLWLFWSVAILSNGPLG